MTLLSRAYHIGRPVLPFLLAAGLLAGLALRVDSGAIRDQLRDVNPAYLPLILGANFASDWFRGVRWQHLLSPMQRPSVALLFGASQLGSAVNLLVPFRAGEAVRVRIVSKRTGLGASSLVGSLFSEVISDLVAFSSYAVIALFLTDTLFLWPLAVALAGLLVVGLVAGYHLAGRVERERAWVTAGTGMRSWFRRELNNFATGLQALRDARTMFHVMWSAQAIWLLEAVMFWACGKAIGVDIWPGSYLLLVVVANVAGAFPVTQSGFGVFEVTLVGVMVAMGVNEAQAAAYALFTHLLLTAPHLLSGPIAAAALRLNPADILFITRKAAAEGATIKGATPPG